jgi:hypothetical protein
MFVKDLRAAVPLVRPSRPRDGDTRRRILKGIAIRGTQSAGPRTNPVQFPEAAVGLGWSEDHPIASPNGGPTGDLAEIERPVAPYPDTIDAPKLSHHGSDGHLSRTMESPNLAALARVVAVAITSGQARLHPLDGATIPFASPTSAPRLGYVTAGQTVLILEEPARRILRGHLDESTLASALSFTGSFQLGDRTLTAVELPLSALSTAPSASSEGNALIATTPPHSPATTRRRHE